MSEVLFALKYIFYLFLIYSTVFIYLNITVTIFTVYYSK